MIMSKDFSNFSITFTLKIALIRRPVAILSSSTNIKLHL